MSQDSPRSDLQLSERDELLRRIQELEERCRRAEDALRTSDERNRLLGDSAPFGIIVVEPEGHVFGANRIMLDMLAWPSDRDVTELNVLQHPPLVDSGVADAFRRCLEKRGVLSAIIPVCGLGMDANICAIISALSSNRTADFPELSPLSKTSLNSSLPRKRLKPARRNIVCLFESAPVAMIERDAGELKRHLEQLRAEGITDLHRFFIQNPQEVARCMGLIKTVDCNTAFLDLMEAQTRDEIDSGIRLSNSPEDVMRMARGNHHDGGGRQPFR